jgi:hypothetical protein
MIGSTLSECNGFSWVEEVRGPLSKRKNRIVRIDEVPLRPSNQELYRSVYLSDDRLKNYVTEHKGGDSASGIKGFRGPCTILNLPFDIDRETKRSGETSPDWDRAIRDARQLLELLRVLYEIELGMVRCCLTGGRGVHVYLPAAFFGGFDPADHVPEVVKAIAMHLGAEAAVTIDPTIYDRNRLLRVPNSRHPSGKFCVPLYASELIHVDTDKLLSMMERPRPEITWVGEVSPVAPLVELKHQCETGILTTSPKPVSWPDPPEGREAEIRAVLTEQSIDFKIQGDDFVISCPTGNHADSEPSFRIHRRSGICHCFGCEAKGNWDHCKDLIEQHRAEAEAYDTNPAPTTLIEVKNPFNRWLYLEDDTFIDLGLATVVAHNFEGDPLWIFLVGAPGSCKTEFLRSLACRHTYQLSALTEHSLVSGLNIRGRDPSLLPKLNNKVLVIKDFTAVLSARHEVRTEIFGQLRDVYDGYLQKYFGSGVGVRDHKCHLGVLAGVTPEIDRYHSVDQALGERFLKVRVSYDDPDQAVQRARRNAGEQIKMRRELNEVVKRFLELRWPSKPTAVFLPQEFSEKINSLASLVALLRTSVPKDHKGRLEYMPIPEVGTRLAVQLSKLGTALSLVRSKAQFGEDEYRALLKVGRDTLPSLRWELLTGLASLHRAGSWHKTKDIGNTTGIATETVNVALQDLRLLHVVERSGSGQFAWRFTDRVLNLFENTGLCVIGEVS